MFTSFNTCIPQGCGSNLSECLIASRMVEHSLDRGARVISGMDTNSLQIKGYAPFLVLPEVTGGVFDVPDRYYQDSGRELIFCAGVGRSIGGGTADADIGAPEAWAITTSSSRVIVAVVDTGVDYTDPDLATYCIGGYNAITGTTNPMDDHSHGTHCAGTIAGIGNNGVGVAEVTWSSRIIPLKFLDLNRGV